MARDQVTKGVHPSSFAALVLVTLVGCGSTTSGRSSGGLLPPPAPKEDSWSPQSPQPKWWEAGLYNQGLLVKTTHVRDGKP